MPLAVAFTANASLYPVGCTNGVNVSFTSTGAVPDNNYSGWPGSRLVNTMPAGTLPSVAVNLHLTGGWNGDLYACIVNSVTGFSVSLDRVGPGPYGYGDAGMNVTLASVNTFAVPQVNIDSCSGSFTPAGS